MAKTKWIIDPGTLTIYPKRNLRIVGLVFFILVAVVIYFLVTQMSGYAIATSTTYYGALLLIPLLLIFFAESKVIFNGTDRRLYKKIGFLPIGSIPFDDIAAIEPYETLGSGFNYSLFKKVTGMEGGWWYLRVIARLQTPILFSIKMKCYRR